jgi:hypothetical protein
MRTLRSKISSFAALGGIAAIAIAVGCSAAAAAPAGGPVCGTKADGPKTYPSMAAAKADGAKVAHPGDCLIFCQGFGPTIIQQPICGMDPLNHARMTYPNNCEAENAHAIWVHAGPCKK